MTRVKTARSLRTLPLIAGLLVTGWAFAQEASPAGPAGAIRWPAVRSAVPSDPKLEARIDAILARMPIEEKVAQVIQPDINSITPEGVSRYKFGSILAMVDQNACGQP